MLRRTADRVVLDPDYSGISAKSHTSHRPELGAERRYNRRSHADHFRFQAGEVICRLVGHSDLLQQEPLRSAIRPLRRRMSAMTNVALV
jgi:hypothetical protein